MGQRRMKTYHKQRQELTEAVCPAATQDLHLNLKNRQHAIDEYFYGPANPEEPGTYWKDAADRWSIDEKTAKTMKCENCAAFDVSDRIRKCISVGMAGKEKGVNTDETISLSDLGYCNILHFKCAGTRSCTAWLTNGPIVKDA